jgi:hypothetical protein
VFTPIAGPSRTWWKKLRFGEKKKGENEEHLFSLLDEVNVKPF